MHRSLMINFHFLCDISGYVLVINILYIHIELSIIGIAYLVF